MIAIHEWAKCHKYTFHAMAEVTLQTQTSLFIDQSYSKDKSYHMSVKFNLVFGRDHLFQYSSH